VDHPSREPRGHVGMRCQWFDAEFVPTRVSLATNSQFVDECITQPVLGRPKIRTGGNLSIEFPQSFVGPENQEISS
jgi:hypothetical protein